MVSGDWLAQAMQVVERARRDVRLTLPPGQHELFWSRLLERAELIPHRLTFHALLPATPLAGREVTRALAALFELESGRHTVSLAAADAPFPWFLLISDRETALGAVGDAYDGDDAYFVQVIDESARVQDLAASFDRRFAAGIAEPDISAWRQWLGEFPRSKAARSAVSMLERGRKKLDRVARRTIRTLPKRGFWIVKPSPAAWGLSEHEGEPFARWLKRGTIHLGWPKLADLFHGEFRRLPLRAFRERALKHYPEIEDSVRVRAVARAFFDTLHERDRVIAMDGWTAKQEAPVLVHGWGGVQGPVELREDAPWPICRAVRWRTAGVELPIKLVREATGKLSATYPLHRLTPEAFRDLVDAVENRRRRGASPQLSLTLDLFANGEEENRLL